VVIHICLETKQGNSLCSYLYLKLKKKKSNIFLFIFYIFSYFFFYKIREQEGRTGPVGGRGVWAPEGMGRWQGKEVGG
jgi:hypothetical protein